MKKNELHEKISLWLRDQRELLNKEGMQEFLFDIPETLSHLLDQDDKTYCMVKELSHRFLKLSFIMFSNPKEMEKLIEFLDE